MDGKTILTGLLGRPVAHSLSPLIHNTAFEHSGLNYVYLCFDVGEKELEAAVSGLKALGARGWNTTMPDKNAMAGLCDELKGIAAYIGAVNTVVNDNGHLTGWSTDGIGYLRSVRENGTDITGKNITVLGTGGAAVAIIAQAALDGAAGIHILARRGGRYLERLSDIIGRLSQDTGCRIDLRYYDEKNALAGAAEDSCLLVNATSVGMAPDTEGCLVQDSSVFRKDLVVSDIIYHPAQTKLLRLAGEAGCRTFNGEGMLLYQGAEAFRLWTGMEMQAEPVRDKLRQANAAHGESHEYGK